jgi:hypothetical protein
MRYHNAILRFLDGTEQRVPQRRAQLEWHLEFDDLTEQEVRTLADFFEECQGTIGAFRFEDPWTGELLEGCVFAQEEIEFQWLEPGRAKTSIHLRRKGS